MNRIYRYLLTTLLLGNLLVLQEGLKADGVTQEAPSLDIRIPVVNMQDFYDPDRREQFIDTLYQAMSQVGFFAVTNTGVKSDVIKNAYAQAEKFFKQDLETKSECYIKELRGQRGFVPGETAKGTQAKDHKEFYHLGKELSSEDHARTGIIPNVWPKEEGFREALTTLYSELENYVVPLQEAIIETINRGSTVKVSTHFLNDMTKEGQSLLRALYYPALTQEQISSLKEPLFWAAAHTDIDLLAILPYATEKGLQVEIDGQWLNVVVPSDAFIVNVGDMLENLSNGLFVSARHRVVAQEPNKDRFSMVLFVHPTDDSSLAPLPSCIEQTGGIQRYAPGTRQEFLWERLLELKLAPMLLEPYAKTGHTERQIKYGRESKQVVDMLISSGLASQEVLDTVHSQQVTE